MDSETMKWMMNWMTEYLGEVKQQRAALDGISLKMSAIKAQLDVLLEKGVKVDV